MDLTLKTMRYCVILLPIAGLSIFYFFFSTFDSSNACIIVPIDQTNSNFISSDNLQKWELHPINLPLDQTSAFRPERLSCSPFPEAKELPGL